MAGHGKCLDAGKRAPVEHGRRSVAAWVAAQGFLGQRAGHLEAPEVHERRLEANCVCALRVYCLPVPPHAELEVPEVLGQRIVAHAGGEVLVGEVGKSNRWNVDVTIDARKFENGRVHSHGEICPERSLPVAPFMERYLLNLGLNRNNADVGFGRLWISGYHGADSCMMDDNVFGDYANEKYITIRPRKSDLRSDGPAEIDVRFKDELDGRVYTDIKCLCFEYLEVPFRDFLSCFKMLDEDVTFEWRGNLVFAPRTTAHELARYPTSSMSPQ